MLHWKFNCLLCMQYSPHPTNFHVAKSRNGVYFLQHKNLLRGDCYTHDDKTQLATQHLLREKLHINCTFSEKIELTQTIQAKLSEARQQLKSSQSNVNIRFPTTASDHNKLVTQEMCQLYKQTSDC